MTFSCPFYYLSLLSIIIQRILKYITLGHTTLLHSRTEEVNVILRTQNNSVAKPWRTPADFAFSMCTLSPVLVK